MLAHTLPQLVQDHRQQVVRTALDRLHREDELTGLHSDACDFAEWFDAIVAALERWPAIAIDDDQEQEQRAFGARCARLGVPLHHVVRAVHILKSKIVDFARAQGVGRSSLEVYVEEELENRVSFFFDWLVYQVILGYESAQPARFA